jgi:broad specificity phosphatase PhoE
MDLYLVRHGQSVGNRDRYVQSAETPLAPAGLDQAAITGRWLAAYFGERGTPPAVLYSSDLRRAWQTAAIIGAALGLTPIPDPRLRERYAGDAEGLAYGDCIARFPAAAAARADWSNMDWGWPGGETRGQVETRVLAAIRDLTARHRPGDQIIAVTHGGPIWAYLRTLDTAQAAIAGANATAPAERVRPGLADNALDVANCSITHIHFPPGGEGDGFGLACLLALGQAAHLAEQ